MPSIFLCHASEDKPLVEPMQLALASAGYEVFFDQQSLPPGGDYQARIRAAILLCDVFVFVASPASVASGKFTLTELRFARERWPSPVDRVLPVAIGGLKPSELPPYLQAVTVLTVSGNLAAEVRAATEAMISRLTPAIGPAPVNAPRAGGYSSGPLTLGAQLRNRENRQLVEAYPTGHAGLHCVFSIHNENQVDFIVLDVEVEVLSFEPATLDLLVHGVGATAVSQRYRADIQPRMARYKAWFVGATAAGQYVKLIPGETEVFDVEITTQAEGLYLLDVHVVGSVGGQKFTVSIAQTGLAVFFFERRLNYPVDRGHGGEHMKYTEYINEMARYDNSLRRFADPDSQPNA